MWHRRGWRGRPPWWPEGEAWPPRDRPDWRRPRGRFFWRIGGMLLFFFLFLQLLALGLGAVLWLVGRALGISELPPGAILLAPLGLLVLVFGLGGVVFLGGAIRRIAAPLGEVIDATARVASGDYAARVRERGPREVKALVASFNAMAERLQSSEAERRRLLADVTHELRTPLTVVQGQLEGLLDGVYARDDAHLEPILEETRVMARLVDDLRTLSLAESGALELRREPTELRALTEDAVEGYREQARAKGVALAVDVAAAVPAVDVDPTRIRQVLTNLVANALQHTETGAIRVRAERDGAVIRVEVTDTGSGIAPDALPHVFDRFTKSAQSRGSGLGLAIARDVVRAHGGEIAAESALGKGTTIRFTLPAAPRV